MFFLTSTSCPLFQTLTLHYKFQVGILIVCKSADGSKRQKLNLSSAHFWKKRKNNQIKKLIFSKKPYLLTQCNCVICLSIKLSYKVPVWLQMTKGNKVPHDLACYTVMMFSVNFLSNQVKFLKVYSNSLLLNIAKFLDRQYTLDQNTFVALSCFQ